MISPIKRTTTIGDSRDAQLQLYNDKVYYVWAEHDGSYYQIWTAVMDTDGNNFVATKRTASAYDKRAPQMQIVDDKIYFVWYSDYGAEYYQIATATMNIDGSGWTTTKRTTSDYHKMYPQLCVSGSYIYYAWEERIGSYTQVATAVMNINGSGWSEAVRTSYPNGYVRKVQLQVSNGYIYYVWYKNATGDEYQIYTARMAINGTGWAAVKRTSSAYDKVIPQLQVVGSKIYYVYLDYSGDYHDVWTAVMNIDGTGWEATQRTTTDYDKEHPQLQVIDDKIYYIYLLKTGTPRQIMTATMGTDGSGWTAIQGTNTAYLKQYPQLDMPYYVWEEKDDDGHYQIWTGRLLTGKSSITTSVDIILFKTPNIINIKATKLAGNLTLYGEITEKYATIIERGFEYKIQDNEPGEEETGTEVKEEKETGFDVGEYNLSSQDTFKDLYCAEENTIWWFRAYCKDKKDNKFVAETWMKNVPTVTTDGVSTTVFTLTGEGDITDLGANKVTKRGMRIVKNFVGSIHDTLQYREKGFTVYSQEHRSIYTDSGILTGFEWVIVFEKYVYTEKTGGYETGAYEITTGDTLMTGLIPGDNYDIYAFAENNLGKGFGEPIAANTLLMVVEEEPIEGKTTAEKTIFINDIPSGSKVIRAGIRYGRTTSCNEGYVEKTGEWGNGDTITFFLTGLNPDTKYYEEPYFILEDEEGNQEEVAQESGEEDDPYADKYTITKCESAEGGTKTKATTGENHELENGDRVIIYGTNYYDGEYEISNITDNTFYFDHEFLGDDQGYWWYGDEPFPFPDIDTIFDDDFPEINFPDMDEQGIDYELVVSQIKCNKIADQSIIDMYGRRRSTTITNHLIQDMDTCKAVRDNYINEFQILKLKVVLDYDIPIPFERADCILLGDGKYNYKEDGEGVIGAKADGEGIVEGQKSLIAKIRKIDVKQISGKGAILTLELEV